MEEVEDVMVQRLGYLRKAEEEERAAAAVLAEQERLRALQEEELLRVSQPETARQLAEAHRLQEVAAAASARGGRGVGGGEDGMPSAAGRVGEATLGRVAS